MKHCAVLARCCQTLAVAQRSWCGLAVVDKRHKGDRAAWDWWVGWWRGALWAARWSPKAVLGVIACSLMGSTGPQVKFSMYVRYLRAVGWCLSFWIVMGYVGQNVAYVGSNLWLSDWTDDSVRYLNQTYPTHLRDLRIGVYGALGVAQGECGDSSSHSPRLCGPGGI